MKTFLVAGVVALLGVMVHSSSFANERIITISGRYLNIPVGNDARMKQAEIRVAGKLECVFPVQLAEQDVDYWIFIDVSSLKGKKIVLSIAASDAALKRIYNADKIAGEDSLYKEYNRPQFHLTTKRGWSNDINGPIYIDGTYHVFWQSFPFGKSWNTGYMYWAHATSRDLLHWTQQPDALTLDSLGSPWSGSAVIDHRNDAGFGKDALILFYTAYDRIAGDQVQCIAYSTDGAKTFQRYSKNPVLDTHLEVGSHDTRDPKVFYHAASQAWVMALFEKDGISFFRSANLKDWKRSSHFPGLHECPDFFELPVDGNADQQKWVLHGGSASYYVGSFDGKVFTPETPRLSYAEGRNKNGDDILYAALSFENEPQQRRIQMAWGRVEHEGMPFTQMMLFPTTFRLTNTSQGIRLRATPVSEISLLHADSSFFSNLSIAAANRKLVETHALERHIVMEMNVVPAADVIITVGGRELHKFPAGTLATGLHRFELLMDRTSTELFVDDGAQYIVRDLGSRLGAPQWFFGDKPVPVTAMSVYRLKPVWQ